MWPFKFFGSALMFFAAVLVAVIILNRSTAARGGRDLFLLCPQALIYAVIGIGLLRHSQLAAFLFVCGSVGLGGFLIISSLMPDPFPVNLANVVFGSLLALPSVFMCKNWSMLRK